MPRCTKQGIKEVKYLTPKIVQGLSSFMHNRIKDAQEAWNAISGNQKTQVASGGQVASGPQSAQQTQASTQAGFQTGMAGQAKQGKTAQEQQDDASFTKDFMQLSDSKGQPLDLWEKTDGNASLLLDGKGNMRTKTTLSSPQGDITRYEYTIQNPHDPKSPFHVVLERQGHAKTQIVSAKVGDTPLDSSKVKLNSDYTMQIKDGSENVRSIHRSYLDATPSPRGTPNLGEVPNTTDTSSHSEQSQPSAAKNSTQEAANQASPVTPQNTSSQGAQETNPTQENKTQQGAPPPPPPPNSGPRAGGAAAQAAQAANAGASQAQNSPFNSSQVSANIRWGKALGQLPPWFPENPTPEDIQAMRAWGFPPQLLAQMGLLAPGFVPPQPPMQQQGGVGGFIQRHPFLTGALAGVLGGALPMLLMGGLGGFGGTGMMAPLLMMGGMGNMMLPMMIGMGGFGGGGMLGGLLMGSMMGNMQALPYLGMAGNILAQGQMFGGLLTPFFM
jgi:hypothetical protein